MLISVSCCYRAVLLVPFILLIVCGAVRASLNHGPRETINEVSPSETKHANGLPSIRLPHFLQIGIKYSFARSWITKYHGNATHSDVFCNAEERKQLRNCGLQQLSEALEGSLSTEEKAHSTLDMGDFNSNLDALCSHYQDYNKCVQEYMVDDCTAMDKLVVDLLYSYICSEGKQALKTSYTGMCLSSLKQSSVNKATKAIEGCELQFTDMSYSVLTMFSRFHLDGEDVDNEKVSMLMTLEILCRKWKNFEKCLLPVYGKLCEKAAKLFYAGLLDKTKKELAKVYERFGSDLYSSAQCSDTTGELTSVPKLTSMSNDLMHYSEKQRDIFYSSANIFRVTCGPCSSLASLFQMITCFWDTIYKAGPNIQHILLDFLHNEKDICRSLDAFQHCYRDRVSSCPPSNKVDFGYTFQTVCNLLNDPRKTCPGAMTVLRGSETRCGTTLAELVEHYMFKGAIIYDITQLNCEDSLPPLDLDLGCLNEGIELAASEGAETTCVQWTRDLLKSLKNVTSQASVLFNKSKQAACSKTC